jgi:hypothetical protein
VRQYFSLRRAGEEQSGRGGHQQPCCIIVPAALDTETSNDRVHSLLEVLIQVNYAPLHAVCNTQGMTPDQPAPLLLCRAVHRLGALSPTTGPAHPTLQTCADPFHARTRLRRWTSSYGIPTSTQDGGGSCTFTAS